MTTRHEVLKQNIEARELNIMGYQINIDNYRAAISDIEANHPDLAPFAEELLGRLKSEEYEQKKEQVMLAALKFNLEEKGV
jgi:hypothetical protein